MRKLLAITILLVLCSVAYAGPTSVYGSLEQIFSSLFGETLVSYNGNATAGDTTILAVGASEKFRIYRVDFSSIGDVTGTVNIQLGAVNALAMVNTTGGSLYGMNLSPLFQEGALGADLVINTPTAVNYNIHGKVM